MKETINTIQGDEAQSCGVPSTESKATSKLKADHLFRWKVRKVANPSSRWAERVSQFTLLCNQCDASVISGAPYSDPGRRYFTLYAREAALERLGNNHPASLVARS